MVGGHLGGLLPHALSGQHSWPCGSGPVDEGPVGPKYSQENEELSKPDNYSTCLKRKLETRWSRISTESKLQEL